MSALVDDFIMKMRTGRTAGIATRSYAFTPLYLHTLGNAYRLHMGISRLVAESMVYHHRIAVAEELELHTFHDAIARGVYRIARLHCEIDSAMPPGASCERVTSVTETA